MRWLPVSASCGWCVLRDGGDRVVHVGAHALELALHVADGADGGGAVVLALGHGGEGLALDSGCHGKSPSLW
jgi:hypothetical protein